MKEWRVYAKAKPGQTPGIIITFPPWDEHQAYVWFRSHQTDKPGYFYEGMTLELVEFETEGEFIKRERDRLLAFVKRVAAIPSDEFGLGTEARELLNHK